MFVMLIMRKVCLIAFSGVERAQLNTYVTFNSANLLPFFRSELDRKPVRKQVAAPTSRDCAQRQTNVLLVFPDLAISCNVKGVMSWKTQTGKPVNTELQLYSGWVDKIVVKENLRMPYYRLLPA